MKKPIIFLLIGMLPWSSTFAVSNQAAQAPVTISAEEILDTNSDLRGEITKALNDQNFVNKLASLGVDKFEVQNRLNGMTDRELMQVQMDIQRQAGGAVVVISLGALLLILIIVLLLR